VNLYQVIPPAQEKKVQHQRGADKKSKILKQISAGISSFLGQGDAIDIDSIQLKPSRILLISQADDIYQGAVGSGRFRLPPDPGVCGVV